MSILRLGLCRARLKEFDLAVEEFESGIQGIELMNPVKMEMLYWQADTYQKADKVEEAISRFTEIYKVKSDFKDIGERIRKLKSQSNP